MTALLAATFLLLQLLCQVFVTEGAGRELPNGYVRYREYNAAYKIHRDKVKWNEAWDRCVAEGAHLAVFNSVDQMRQIVDSSIRDSEVFMYTGIRRSSTNSPWLRVDNGLPVSLQLYDFGNSNCAGIWRGQGGSFSDHDCDTDLAFVCERSLTEEAAGCELPSGYVRYREYNAAYKVHRDKVKWNDAWDRCVAEGAHLAVFNSVEQMRQIVDSSIRDSEVFMYTGIRRSSTNSPWHRVDNGLPVSLQVYDFGNDNCAGIWRGQGGSFSDHDCDTALSFVCERSLTGCQSPVGH